MRPDVTKAQIIAAAAAGVPVLANLLAAFGVFVPSPAEQHALTEATKWATGFAVLLVAGDAHIRGKRNEADAARSAAGPRSYVTASSPIKAGDAVRLTFGGEAVSAEPGRGAAPDEGPGDFDMLASHGVADPNRITPDEGDVGPEVTP